MDCLNFRKEGNKFIFDSIEHEKFKNKGSMIIHWIPEDEAIETEVMMPDTKIIKGYRQSP